jgi:cytochrome P450
VNIKAFSFPASRGNCPFAPPADVSQLLGDAPMRRIALQDGTPAWLVARYSDVRKLLRDSRFSASAHHQGFPWTNDGLKLLNTGDPTPFIRTDGPEHVRIRDMLVADFTPRRAEAMRPRIQQIVDDCLDRMIRRGSPADLVAELALPLPSQIICELLGVEYDDHEFFQQRSRLLLQSSADPTALMRAVGELTDYLVQLIERKRKTPDDTIVSRLVSGGQLSDAEVTLTGILLLSAGHETTANQTTMSTLALLRNPDQLSLLRAQPGLIKDAVEELLRYASIMRIGVPRVATEDVTVGGQLVPNGEGVICMLDTANHDERVFATPEELDVTREARSHVAFGFGVHQCLGQSLARVELQVVLDTLLRRLPGLRLGIPFEELRFNEAGAVYGIDELPIAW